MKIITLVEEPTDWVNSFVLVKEMNGNFQFCLDPCQLNQANKRLHNTMLITKEVLAEMSNATVFAMLDASNAYWQIPVDEGSSKLPKFNSPNGRYCFLHMLYIQAVMFCQSENILECLNRDVAANRQDDIILWREDIKWSKTE